jgi:hypothetical protein
MITSILQKKSAVWGALLVAAGAAHGATVFSDDFTGSSLNSATPAAPTATSTSYQLLSSKAWSPAPSIAANDLKFGIAATTAGHIEAQALFAGSPVSLVNVGDSLTLTVTFLNTSGLFTMNGLVGFGLYNSGGVGPLAGGMNGNATSSTTGVTGGANGWQGYVSKIGFNGQTSRISTRPAQSATLGNNQDVLTEGSGSQSYLGAVHLGSLVSTVTQPAATQLTEQFRLTLTAAGTYQIDSTLFLGADVLGSQLFTETATASGANYLTGGFDAFAIGWRATANTSASTIDIQSVNIDFTATPAPEPTVVALAGMGFAALMTFRRRLN